MGCPNCDAPAIAYARVCAQCGYHLLEDGRSRARTHAGRWRKRPGSPTGALAGVALAGAALGAAVLIDDDPRSVPLRSEPRRWHALQPSPVNGRRRAAPRDAVHFPSRRRQRRRRMFCAPARTRLLLSSLPHPLPERGSSGIDRVDGRSRAGAADRAPVARRVPGTRAGETRALILDPRTGKSALPLLRESSSAHVEAPWKRQTAAERNGRARPIARRAVLSYKPQQTAAVARALQAGGRPFEPGTAHLRESASEAALRP
jgi:hypothetical protein